ncbi:MAG: carbohydrate-binding domain-containing protein [Clostridia bacterium]|nr:carbohydrate-binding domain-containing protein [Clostridia bacterium]
MKKIKILVFCLCLILGLTAIGCNENTNDLPSISVSQPDMSVGENGEIISSQTFVSGITNQTVSNLDSAITFTTADLEDGYDSSSAVTITLNGNTATCSSTTNYVKTGNKYVIISGAGVYIITGSSQDLILYVQADKTLDKVTLVLDNANMQHSSFAPIYIKSANKTFIYAQGENYLATTGNFVQKDTNNVDGVLFSKDDLCLKGSGTLNVNSNFGHGIVAKDDFKVVNLTLNIVVSGHGIDSNDSTRVNNANINISSGQDGIKVENLEDLTVGYFYFASGNLTINALHDGIDCSERLQIDSGNIKIVAGNSTEINSTTNSKNAIKAGSSVGIYGGNLLLYSSECGLKGTAFNINNAKILSLSASATIGTVNGVRFNSQTLKMSKSYEIKQNGNTIFSFNAEYGFYNLLYIDVLLSGGGFTLV